MLTRPSSHAKDDEILVSLAQSVSKARRDSLRKVLQGLRAAGVADFETVAEAIAQHERDGTRMPVSSAL